MGNDAKKEPKKLISLKDHEKRFLKNHKRLEKWQPSGIACPDCGQELEVDCFNVLLSSPPKRQLGCKNCGYRGSTFSE